MKKLLWKILHGFYRPPVFSRDGIKNILVIRMNRIGDMICTIPLLKTLKREFPEIKLTLLADETNADIIRNASYIDKLLVYGKGTGIYRSKFLQLRHFFKGHNFDIAIGVKGGFSSTLAIMTSLSRSKYRVGYTSDNNHPVELLYNLPARKKTDVQHQVEQCLNLLVPLGITSDKAIRDISIEVTEKSKFRFRDFMLSHNMNPEKGSLAVINVSNDGPVWPLENFAKLIRKLQEDSITCIVTSAPADFDIAKKLARDCSGLPPALFYETPHIMDFAAAVKASDILISHDSGAMHIGAAVNTKTLVLIGRGINPEVWGPYGDGHRYILKPEIQDITVDDAYNEILRMTDAGAH